VPQPAPVTTMPDVRPVELPAAKPADVASAVPTPAKPVEIAKVALPPTPPKPIEKPKIADKPKPAEPPPGWRVQLGAFGKRAQAETAWAEIKAKHKAAVGSAKPIYAPGTSIIKLQMGPYKTRDLAKDACAKIAFSGRACFVTEG
jgi:uncharacterized protein